MKANDGGYIQYRVALFPISNDIAINGYLELIKDLSYKYAPEHDMFIILSKMGESVRREWYLSKNEFKKPTIIFLNTHYWGNY